MRQGVGAGGPDRGLDAAGGGPAAAAEQEEAEFATGFTSEFTSVATREAVPKAVLRRRLLLVLFVLGTSMGIKLVAVTGKHGESEAVLRRVRQLFVNRAVTPTPTSLRGSGHGARLPNPARGGNHPTGDGRGGRVGILKPIRPASPTGDWGDWSEAPGRGSWEPAPSPRPGCAGLDEDWRRGRTGLGDPGPTGARVTR